MDDELIIALIFIGLFIFLINFKPFKKQEAVLKDKPSSNRNIVAFVLDLQSISRLKFINKYANEDIIEVVEESRGVKLKKNVIELFSGEFWSGSKAKELGLIDCLGNANEVLKEKFGDDIVIKKFEKSKGWLSKKLASSNQMDQLVNILEERSIWQRYGF